MRQILRQITIGASRTSSSTQVSTPTPNRASRPSRIRVLVRPNSSVPAAQCADGGNQGQAGGFGSQHTLTKANGRQATAFYQGLFIQRPPPFRPHQKRQGALLMR